ncbi:MAG: hypothetical protein R3E39_08705 [Anaerolineae bacterium]
MALSAPKTGIHARGCSPPRIGEDPSRIIALVLWVGLTLGFLLVTAGAFGWQSLVGGIVYWNSFAFIFNKIGMIAVNIVIIYGVLVANWPSKDVLA